MVTNKISLFIQYLIHFYFNCENAGKCQEPSTYRGITSVSSSGEPCLPWPSGPQHSETFIDGSRKAAVNYCRSVNYYRTYLSCYTGSSKLAYQPCAVDLCGKFYLLKIPQVYLRPQLKVLIVVHIRVYTYNCNFVVVVR